MAPNVTLAQTSAQASTPKSPSVSGVEAPQIGEIEFGVRLSSIAGDPGRFQRYRDLRSGPTTDRLRYTRDQDSWRFNAEFDHVGYLDQRYLGEYERFGKVKASFEWNQIPLFYGDITSSPFRKAADGVFRLDDSIQAAVQDRTATLAGYSSEITRFDTRSRRDIADMRVTYNVKPHLDLRFSLTSTGRTGQQPWGASFGFSNANEVPVTLQNRTNDLNTAAEWSNRRGMVRLAYDGSWFNNDVGTLVWDNPLRATDQTHANAYSTGDGSSQGRMALWPNSTAHTVSASGSVALPARSRAFAYVSVGSWLQDAQLLPHTINTAIAPIPLPRQTAEAEARITSMNYRVTSRPTPTIWLSGQYRLHDYDNRTPHFAVDQYVRLDGNVATSATGGSEPFDYTRHFVDLDASFTPFRFAAFRFGYGQENDDRTFRLFEETTDRTFRASVDSTGMAWASARLQYDHSVRTGEGLDEQVLSDIGEQISLRQFDISDRTRDRVTGIFQIVPIETLGFNASVAIGQESRPDAAFGLQDNDLLAFTFGVDFTPNDRVGAAVSYGFENYSTRQQSRQANPGAQFNDPTRDWWTDMDENVHTFTANLDLTEVVSRTVVSLGYDFVGSRARYVYTLRPDTTLVTPQQLPAVRNEIQRATVEVRYTLTRQLALGLGYWFEKYNVEDFAFSPGTLNSPLIPAFVNLMNQWRPYVAHTGLLRLIYSW